MKLFGRDLQADIVVIAEVGVNHEGNVEVAEGLVRAAAAAGADAVKFQSYTPDRFILPTDPERFARVTRFGLDEAAHRHLAAVAQEAGITFFSAAITEDWVPLIAELSPVIKIASGDLNFETLIRAAAATGRVIVLSTGCGTTEEVDRAVNWVAEQVGRDKLAERLVLLHCVSAYPAPVEQVNLNSIPYMAERYGLFTGWSNHVIGPDVCLAAVAAGARIVEVHVTDRKVGRTFRDHELSFEPADLADLVVRMRSINLAMGQRHKEPAPCESAMRVAIRKGIGIKAALPVDHVLGRDDLFFVRPMEGVPAGEIERIIGRKLKRPVSAGALLQWDDVAGKN